MTPEQKRTFNTIIGSAFMSLGVIAWMLAVFFSVTPAKEKPHPVLETRLDVESCKKTLNAMGFEVTAGKGPGQLELKQTTIAEDASVQLATATAAATVCKLNMTSFCMGEACPTPGISMVLTPSLDAAPATASAVVTAKAKAKPAK